MHLRSRRKQRRRGEQQRPSRSRPARSSSFFSLVPGLRPGRFAPRTAATLSEFVIKIILHQHTTSSIEEPPVVSAASRLTVRPALLAPVASALCSLPHSLSHHRSAHRQRSLTPPPRAYPHSLKPQASRLASQKRSFIILLASRRALLQATPPSTSAHQPAKAHRPASSQAKPSTTAPSSSIAYLPSPATVVFVVPEGSCRLASWWTLRACVMTGIW